MEALQNSTEGRVDNSWLWAVRAVTTLSLLVMLGGYLAIFRSEEPAAHGQRPFATFIALSLATAAVPYFWVLFVTRKNPPGKFGLQIAFGAAAMVASITFLAAIFRILVGPKWALIGVMHVALALASIKVYFSSRSESRNLWDVFARAFVGLLIAGIFFLVSASVAFVDLFIRILD